MRAPYESLAVLKALVQELDPHRFKAAVYHELKGGLPAGGSDGRGSADPPLPGFDPTDADLVRKNDEYGRRLDQLANLALEEVRLQRGVLWERPTPIAKTIVLAALGEEADGKQERVWWCQSCYRANHHHSPVADEKRGGKDCNLCRWCLDIYRDTGAWPPIEWVKARAEGRRILVKEKP